MTRAELFKTAMKRGKAGIPLTDAQWRELQRAQARLPEERAKRKAAHELAVIDAQIAEIVAAHPKPFPWLLAAVLTAMLLQLALLALRFAL